MRPGLATTGGPLIIASSPYARRGVLFEAHRRHWGASRDPLILVAQGASREFNPSLPQAVVDRALERDAASASAEYLAQFRTDIAGFVSREAIADCCCARCLRARAGGGFSYCAFVDPSGGSADSITLAIGHQQGTPPVTIAVVDAVREIRPPFSPENVVGRIRRAAEIVPRRHRHWRSLCGRVAARAIPRARDQLRGGGTVQVRDFP